MLPKGLWGKKVLLLLIFVSIFTELLSQNVSTIYNIDTIKKKVINLKLELNKIKEDSVIVENYLQQADEYEKLKKFDSSFYFTFKAYNLSKKIKYDHGYLGTIRNIITINNRIGNYDESLRYTFESMYFLIKKKDTGNLLNTYHLISKIYGSIKDYKNMLIYAKKLTDLAAKRNWRFVRNKNTFYENKYYPLSEAYLRNNMLDSALYYSMIDYQNAVKSDQYDWLMTANAFLGETHLLLKSTDIALAYFEKSKVIALQNKSYDALPYIYNYFTKAYNIKNVIDSQLYYSQESYKYSKIYDNTETKLIALENLYKIYAKKNELANAYKFQTEYFTLKDSIFSEDKVRNIENRSITELERQAEIEENEKQAKEEKKKNIVLAGIGAFIPIFLSIVFLVSNWGKKKSKFITSLGLASLLMLFEFISLLIHPLIDKITNHNVGLMYIILLSIASLLVPLHHKMEQIVKTKLSN
jgi:hypothetical protein